MRSGLGGGEHVLVVVVGFLFSTRYEEKEKTKKLVLFCYNFFFLVTHLYVLGCVEKRPRLCGEARVLL